MLRPDAKIPSDKKIKSVLDDEAMDDRRKVLSELPETGRLSLVVDCWSSPFRQAFMAIVVNFIDAEWEFRELLLSFKHVPEAHTGRNLADVVLQVLREYGLEERIFCINGDSASNNQKMVRELTAAINHIGDDLNIKIIFVPCMAHVIQLALGRLLWRIKINPTNESVSLTWDDTMFSLGLGPGIQNALGKVSGFLLWASQGIVVLGPL